MKTKSNPAKTITIILAIILIALASFKIGIAFAHQENLITPRVSGVWLPLTGDNFAVVVLNTNNPYESQLVQENQKAFSEITKLNGGNK